MNRIPELRELERGMPAVAGEELTTSVSSFYRRCFVLLDEEQRKISPDNALIALLCDAVRFTREHCHRVNDNLLASEAEQVSLIRSKACVETLLIAFRQAIKVGGKDAKMHVGDCVRVIDEFQKGTMDKGAPITGPFYDRGVQ